MHVGISKMMIMPPTNGWLFFGVLDDSVLWLTLYGQGDDVAWATDFAAPDSIAEEDECRLSEAVLIQGKFTVSNVQGMAWLCCSQIVLQLRSWELPARIAGRWSL